MSRIAIIGHSHAVAILDAIGSWRELVNLDTDHGDREYTASFQGWYAVNTGKLFELTSREPFEVFQKAIVSLVTAGTPNAGCLATASGQQGGSICITVSPLLRTFLDHAKDCDAVISVLHGNQHAIRSLVNDMPEYDFAPYESDDSPYCPIDSSYISQVLAEDVGILLPPLVAIRTQLKKAKLIHVPPPPPLKDPSASPVYEKLGDRFRQYGFVRPSLRLKWYLSYLRALRSAMSQWAIHVAEPCVEAMSEDGFLNPEYSEGLTHGNVRYGGLMARHLSEIIREI